MKCPEHLQGYVEPIGNFSSILPGPISDFFVGYRVKCKCGCREFKVKKNERPLVISICIKCSQEVILYDTNQYPSAISYDKEGDLINVIGLDGEMSYAVCVAFEYPEPDDDEEEYTNNDISWGYIYGCPGSNPRKAFTILNDETM